MTCGKCLKPCQVVERPHLKPPLDKRSDCCTGWIKEIHQK